MSVPHCAGGSPPTKKAKLNEPTTDAEPYHLLDRDSFDNQLFREFYKEFVPADEFDTFMNTLFTELPGTFRICGSRGDVTAVIQSRVERLAEIVNKGSSEPHLTQNTSDTKKDKSTSLVANVDDIKASMKPLEWFPGGLAWQVHAGRHTLRKQEDPLAQQLRTFLIEESNVGHISRQEAVSMIPPLFLQIQEHHKVLDMCAAPGSKTSQLIEMLHRDAQETYNTSFENPLQYGEPLPGYQGIVRGVVHANDSDAKRCNTLITQTKRLCSPCLMVTKHDAQHLPTIVIKKSSDEKDEGIPLLYDRILCDVPCSGDGTLRKNADLWTRWLPSAGHGLHLTQLQILTRAIGLAAPGARIVYSTCSLNPVEDEAVISAAISNSGGKVRLVDVSDQLPKLKRRAGLHTWKCMDSQKNWYTTHEEVPESLKKKIHSSAFPPSIEVAQEQRLERCMRFFPHDQDTGGFFVAVLERVDVTGNADEKKKKQKYVKNIPPAEYTKLPAEKMNEIWPSIQSFYGLKDTFPQNQLVCHGEAVTKMYLTTHAASLLVDNDTQHRLNMKSLGIRVFEKLGNGQGSSCIYRTTQDGVESLWPFLGPQRVVHLTEAADLEKLLTAEDPLFDEFSQSCKARFDEMEIGSVVFSYYMDRPEAQSGQIPKQHVLLVGWRGKVSAHLLLKAMEKKSILSALSSSIQK